MDLPKFRAGQKDLGLIQVKAIKEGTSRSMSVSSSSSYQLNA